MRATVQNIRAIHKYKDEFPVLFEEYTKWKKEQKDYQKETGFKYSLIDYPIYISKEGHKEYSELVSKYLVVKEFPDNNREVQVVTDTGGDYVGFYEEDQWWYRTCEGNKVAETGMVIKWKEYTE